MPSTDERIDAWSKKLALIERIKVETGEPYDDGSEQHSVSRYMKAARWLLTPDGEQAVAKVAAEIKDKITPITMERMLAKP